jgi:hypothetical protein
VRSKIPENVAYYGLAGTKAFKTDLNTVVNHLVYVASPDGVSVYDPDGNKLASLKFETPQDPVQLLKS